MKTVETSNETTTSSNTEESCTTNQNSTCPSEANTNTSCDTESVYDSTQEDEQSSDASCSSTQKRKSGGAAKALLAGAMVTLSGTAESQAESSTCESQTTATVQQEVKVSYKFLEVEGQQIFYREAGPKDAPTVLLLHGFPTSSHMFRNLIPKLAKNYHVIAPDMVGFGQSSAPAVDEFSYTFDNMASVIDQFTVKAGLDNYSLYLMDYGAPIGFRLATKNPKKVDSLIIQNGNAYDEGLREFWKPLKAYWADKSKKNADALRGLLTLEATKWQYIHGTRDESSISPDNWTIDQRLLDRDGNQEIQLAMFYSYGSNPPLYPAWQKYLRDNQPPTLIVWGEHDEIFPAEGAHPYKRDLTNLEFHLLDTGHFALEEDGNKIAKLMRDFLAKNVKK